MKNFKKVVASLTSIVLILGMTYIPAMAETLNVTDIYAEKDFIELTATGAANDISITLRAIDNGTVIETIEETQGDIVTAVPLENLELDTIYEVTVSDGTSEVSKVIRLNTLLFDDFNYSNDDELRTNWRTGTGAGFVPIITLSDSKRLVMPDNNGVGYALVNTKNLEVDASGNPLCNANTNWLVKQKEPWSDYVVEYKFYAESAITSSTQNKFNFGLRDDSPFANELYITMQYNQGYMIVYENGTKKQQVWFDSLEAGDCFSGKIVARGRDYSYAYTSSHINPDKKPMTVAGKYTLESEFMSGGIKFTNGGKIGCELDDVLVYSFEELQVPKSFKIESVKCERVFDGADIITVNFSEPVNKLSLDRIQLYNGGTVMETVKALSNGNKTVSLTLPQGFDYNIVYKLRIDGLDDASTMLNISENKYFMYEILLKDDFQYETDDELNKTWKAYDDNGNPESGLSIDTANNRMLMSRDDSKQYTVSHYNYMNQFDSWGDYTLEYKAEILDYSGESGANININLTSGESTLIQPPYMVMMDFGSAYIRTNPYNNDMVWIGDFSDAVLNIRHTIEPDKIITNIKNTYMSAGASKITKAIYETSAMQDTRGMVFYNTKLAEGLSFTLAISELRAYRFVELEDVKYVENSINWDMPKGTLSGSAYVMNCAADPKSVQVVVAAYSDENELLGIYVKEEVKLNEYHAADVEYAITGLTAKAAYAKTFVLDGFESIKPYEVIMTQNVR